MFLLDGLRVYLIIAQTFSNMHIVKVVEYTLTVGEVLAILESMMASKQDKLIILFGTIRISQSFFDAGNDGVDRDSNGKIDLGSVTPPGTAKNCITVGAIENQRPEFASDTYGKWWPPDFPVEPFKRDPMSDSSSTDIGAF